MTQDTAPPSGRGGEPEPSQGATAPTRLAVSGIEAEPAHNAATAAPLSPGAPGKPTTLTEYKAWALAQLGDDLNERARHRYDTNAAAIQTTTERHDFFLQLPGFLTTVEREFQTATRADLLLTPTLDLSKKPYDSMVDKCFRKNVLENTGFDSAPEGGWITSSTCIERLNDIVRGKLVCRYLDGPEFLAQRLKERADGMGLEARYSSRQNERGYYAFHLYVKIPVQILDVNWNASTVNVDVEIQLTTQLQDVLHGLTHDIYERLRLAKPSTGEKWKWEFSSKRFKASYLGHTLHLIEGLIVELRGTSERMNGEDK